jgi:hypothetical protein
MSRLPVRQLLFVVGMHRCGTSALCSALRASGATFGSSLLAPMEGVNDDGFWEDSDVVRLNDLLLEHMGLLWFTIVPGVSTEFDWSVAGLAPLRKSALAILTRGFGAGPLEVIKDPRLCITLPFWLLLCAELKLQTTVCVINRAPLEVAMSLQKRDGFPPGYGLRLYRMYREFIALNAPANTVYIRYDVLLKDPLKLMLEFARELPLTPSAKALEGAIRSDLRHQTSADGVNLLGQADSGDPDIMALDAEINARYPRLATQTALVQALVARGQDLSEKGLEFEGALEKLSKQHIEALATVDQRDLQISVFDARLTDIGQHLSQALATIPERDLQICELQQQLEALGSEHSHALAVVNERDGQLADLLETHQKLFAMPVIGRLFRRLWRYAER